LVCVKNDILKQDKYYINQVLDGNTNAFSYLVDRYKDMVYLIAVKMLKNSEDAEELSQDIFVKAYSSLDMFKFESKFSTWIYRITYNAAISKLRKKQIEVVDIENCNVPVRDVVSSYNAISELKILEQKKYINMAIESLKEDDALLIILYYLNENSIEEISEITQLTSSNVKVKLFRARKRFYEELKVFLKDEIWEIL
jgi:RNA polymerase sigma factor (sigma-70 family)